ncbi:MAG: SMC-Scp complex subunit ScpB [bacterium]
MSGIETKNINIKSIVESLLFVAEKPLSLLEIAEAIGIPVSEIQKSLKELEADYKNRGISLINKGEYFALISAPENSKEVSRLLNEELRHDLSQAALETLAIITYKQPLTKAEIEEIRGVNSDQIVRNLMVRGLIAEIGRKESVGKPILYGTTMEFIQYCGLENENALPKMEELNLFEKNDEAS